MIRTRPMTTLLLVATVCVDLVLWQMQENLRQSVLGDLPTFLWYSQLGLVSIWLVMGKAHWLIRFSIWTTLILLTHNFQWGTKDDWATSVVLAAFYGISVSTFLQITRLWAEQLRSDNSQDSPEQSHLQFTILQLLVWTTFLAVFFAVYQQSEFYPYSDSNNEPYSVSLSEPYVLIYISTTTGLIALLQVIAVLLLKNQARYWFRLALLLFICFVWTILYELAELVLIGSRFDVDFDMAPFFLIQTIITAIWIITVDYDIARERKLNVQEPELVTENSSAP